MVKKILLISQNQEIAQTIQRLVDGLGDFRCSYVQTLHELKKELVSNKFDLLLIGSGFNAEDEESMKRLAAQHNPEMKIVEHYGGGSGLLYSEQV